MDKFIVKSKLAARAVSIAINIVINMLINAKNNKLLSLDFKLPPPTCKILDNDIKKVINKSSTIFFYITTHVLAI